jgi:hypothetical protein
MMTAEIWCRGGLGNRQLAGGDQNEDLPADLSVRDLVPERAAWDVA